MKNLLLIAVFITSIFATAQNSDTVSEEGITITVTIDNLRNNKGKVIFGLYTEDGFIKDVPFQGAESTIEGNKVKITFTNVPKGAYAIKCLHDENSNNRMDFEASGMPKEDYGMSNNPMSYGPPQFEPSKFDVKDADVTMKIIL